MVFRDCIAFLGQDLTPHLCRKVVVDSGEFVEIEVSRPTNRVEGSGLVLVPAFCNAHTHMGDSPLQDGTVGLTLEEGFFRPHGFKYRELAKISFEEQTSQVADQMRYMIRSGTIAHIDFREQGVDGARMLRAASLKTGMRSVILSQFDSSPFGEGELLDDRAALSPTYVEELEQMLAIADGFSESTMNDLTTDSWKFVRDRTSALSKLRAIHCLENDAYRSGSLEIAGKGDLKRALECYDPHLIVHLTVATDEEIALMAASGKTAALNPRANASLGLPMPPIAKLMEAGVNILLGTDNVMLNCPNMLAELDFAYKLAKSQYGDARRPDPLSILKMATTNLSEAFPGQGRVGIEESNQADFFVADFRVPRLAHSRNIAASVVTRLTPEDVLATVRAGEVLHCQSNFELT